VITLLHQAGDDETAAKCVEALKRGADALGSGDEGAGAGVGDAGGVTAVVFDAASPPQIEAGATVVACVPDAVASVLLPIAAEAGWRLGLLPHPEGKQTRIGFGLASSIKDAAGDILKREDEVGVDLLLCNGRVVLNSVVVGDPLSGTMPEGSYAPTPGGALQRTVAFGRGMLNAVPSLMRLETAKEKKFEAAALGLVVVEHGRGAVLSRRLLGDAPADDGLLHALVYAPRSVLQMVLFAAVSLVTPQASAKRMPSFVGRISTERLKISGARAIGFSVDGRKDSADALELTVRRRALLLIPGRNLEFGSEAGAEPKEIFRVQGLLSADLIDPAKARRLPWLYRATPEEFKQLFQLLRESARASESYVALMALSTVLAVFGLFADSAPVIIGAMILAPLMSPIMAMGMGVVRRGEKGMLYEAVRSFGIGVGIALGVAVVLTLVTPLNTVNSEIGARLNPTLLDMGVAVISGIAGAYAHARAEVARSLAGVAIAVALVPPLAVAGIGIGWGDWEVFSGAGLLFVTNLAGMVLAAAGTFLLLGYSPYHFSRRGLAAAVLVATLVSAMLVPGFVRMVDKHRVIKSLDGWTVEGLEIRGVDIRAGRTARVSVTLVSDRPVTLEQIDAVKAKIAERLGREIVLEAGVVLVR
jgi:uncharacterized hydrophobic protein (TIGR00271 family)